MIWRGIGLGVRGCGLLVDSCWFGFGFRLGQSRSVGAEDFSNGEGTGVFDVEVEDGGDEVAGLDRSFATVAEVELGTAADAFEAFDQRACVRDAFAFAGAPVDREGRRTRELREGTVDPVPA